jgi:hypothetical protein
LDGCISANVSVFPPDTARRIASAVTLDAASAPSRAAAAASAASGETLPPLVAKCADRNYGSASPGKPCRCLRSSRTPREASAGRYTYANVSSPGGGDDAAAIVAASAREVRERI